MDDKTKNTFSALLDPGQFEYLQSTTSTNEVARQWINAGVSHFSLVAADEQTKGRGRNKRTWFTPPNAALAFSLILSDHLSKDTSYYTGLGAVAICRALEQHLQLTPQIKWPNDILLDGKKCSGILVESSWMGSTLQAVILGVGINIAAGSVPPPEQLLFPATAVELAAGHPVDRFALLEQIITEIKSVLQHLTFPQLMSEWNARLAFKGSRVYLEKLDGESINGTLIGIDEQGKLILKRSDGAMEHITANEIHLRPLA
jgi:BirA family biotin operon repressor/biotin-[acetyl-CoA-carboxylase] ligase